MGSATVHEMTREQVAAERDELLAELAIPRDVAERLAEADGLTPDQYRALRRVRDLEWLIAE